MRPDIINIVAAVMAIYLNDYYAYFKFFALCDAMEKDTGGRRIMLPFGSANYGCEV